MSLILRAFQILLEVQGRKHCWPAVYPSQGISPAGIFMSCDFLIWCFTCFIKVAALSIIFAVICYGVWESEMGMLLGHRGKSITTYTDSCWQAERVNMRKIKTREERKRGSTVWWKALFQESWNLASAWQKAVWPLATHALSQTTAVIFTATISEMVTFPKAPRSS